MRIESKFPHKGETLRGNTVRLDVPARGKEELGILLSSSDTSCDWLDVEYTDAALSYSYISGRGLKGVIESQGVITSGMDAVIGRDRHIGNEYVSNRHIHIDCACEVARKSGRIIIKKFIDLRDISLNGTSIWYLSSQTEEETPKQGDEWLRNESKQDDRNADGFDRSEFPEVEGLIAKYNTEFKKLELVDYGILHNIIMSHPEPIRTKKDKISIIRLIHPDRNLTGNADRNHQLFILANRILGIT